jgi:hypothetical protein
MSEPRGEPHVTDEEHWQRTRELLAGFATALALLVCMLEADAALPAGNFAARLRAAVGIGSTSPGTELAFEAIIGEIDRLQGRSDGQADTELIGRHLRLVKPEPDEPPDSGSTGS